MTLIRLGKKEGRKKKKKEKKEREKKERKKERAGTSSLRNTTTYWQGMRVKTCTTEIWDANMTKNYGFCAIREPRIHIFHICDFSRAL